MGNSVRDIYDAAPPLWDWRQGDPIAGIARNEQEAAERDYQRYLKRRGITAEELEQELGEWLDAQD